MDTTQLLSEPVVVGFPVTSTWHATMRFLFVNTSQATE